MRHPAVVVAVAATVAALVRIPRVGDLAYSDEGGNLLVVRNWHSGGAALYGDFWVDRPPLLMLFWRLAAELGGVEAGRWFGCVLVVALVAGAGWAGWVHGGAAPARWSAVAVAALVASPLLGTRAVNAELVASPLLIGSCALTLLCVRRAAAGRPHLAPAALSGVVGAAAVLVKQNFVDALVFAAVLLVATAVRHPRLRLAVARMGACLTAGALVPGLAVAAWAVLWGPGLHELWYTLYGFRADALRVVATQSLTAPAERLQVLGGFGLLSGVVALTCVYGLLRGPALRREPMAAAVTAMLAVGLAGIALGGSYWAHYLIGLVPALGLAVADLVATSSTARRWATGTVVVAVVSALVSTVAAEASSLAPTRATETSVTHWLAAAATAGDTAVITYGHPHVIEAAGLAPAYPYLWSLPARTLDPGLTTLTDRVSGPDRPTWVVEWDSFDSWGLDSRGRLAAAVERGYVRVASVCGVDMFLRAGVRRDLPEVPTACGV